MRGWSSLVLAIVAGIGCAKTGGAGPVAGAGAAEAPGVALVEWQFPTTASAEIRVDPLQKRVVRDDPQLAPAFYPHLSDENATETETGLATLVGTPGRPAARSPPAATGSARRCCSTSPPNCRRRSTR